MDDKNTPHNDIIDYINKVSDTISKNSKDLNSTSADMVRNLFGHVEDSAQTISKKIDEIKNDVSDFSIGSTIKIENEFFKKKKATSTYITKTLVVVTDKSDAIGQKTTGLYDDLSKTISTSFDTLNSKKSKLIDKIQSKKSRTKDKVSDVTDKVFEDISEGYDNIKLSPKECKQIIANLGSIFSGPLLTFIVKAIKNPVLQGESCRNNKVLRNYALFASHVYRKHGTDLPEGWNEVMEFDDPETGLQSTLYRRYNSKEYIYAFAGTQNYKDWVQNGKQILGLSNQYSKALQYAKEIIGKFEIESLTFVGHSQGGDEAAYCAHVLGGKAITFNPAGMSIITKLGSRNKKSRKAQIDSYCYLTDMLTLVQELTDVIPFCGLKADGDIHYIIDKTPKDISIGEFHGMAGFLTYFNE